MDIIPLLYPPEGLNDKITLPAGDGGRWGGGEEEEGEGGGEDFKGEEGGRGARKHNKNKIIIQTLIKAQIIWKPAWQKFIKMQFDSSLIVFCVVTYYYNGYICITTV